MAKLTNAQLLINLEASHVAYAALEQRFEAQRQDLIALRVQVSSANAAFMARKPAYVAPANPARDAAHAAFVAKCAAAKALAMSGKRSVFVE